MEAVTVGEHVVSRCTGCAGLWLNLGELDDIAASSSDVDRLDSGDPKIGLRHNANRDIPCPACSIKMLKVSVPDQPHIEYESCPVCNSAYFDAGELKDYTHVTFFEVVRNFWKYLATDWKPKTLVALPMFALAMYGGISQGYRNIFPFAVVMALLSWKVAVLVVHMVHNLYAVFGSRRGRDS